MSVLTSSSFSRHQVEDISFGFQLPESEDSSHVEGSPDNAASSTHATTRATPRTSEKAQLTPTRQPSGASSRGRSSAQKVEENPDPLASGEGDEDGPRVSEGEDDVLALLPPAPSGRSFTTRRSLATSDVVEESPIHAPGSGHRRSVRDEDIRSSSRRLQSMLRSMGSEAHENMSSSPLTRKSAQRARNQPRPLAHNSPRQARSSNSSLIDDIDELSPQASRSFIGEGEIAEEVGDAEAARVLLRKRPRNSVARKSSPLLDSIVEDHDSGAGSGQDSPTAAKSKSLVEVQPPLKRRKRPQLSPAKQKQPIHKNKSVRKRKLRKPEPSQNDETSADEIGAIDDAAIVPVTVQRFARPRKLARGEDTDLDILAMDIPFVNQKGVNVIDVLAQSCEEVIGACIEQLSDAVQREDSASTRKDLRVKARALEAFAEELRTKFLTQVRLLIQPPSIFPSNPFPFFLSFFLFLFCFPVASQFGSTLTRRVDYYVGQPLLVKTAS